MRRLVSCLSFVLLVGFILAIAAGGAFFFVRYMPSGEKADRSEVYAAERPDGAALFFNFERQQEDAEKHFKQWIADVDHSKEQNADRHDQEDKACAASTVQTCIGFDILRGERLAVFQTVDGLVLCSVILKESADILHPGHGKDISDKDRDAHDAFEQ